MENKDDDFLLDQESKTMVHKEYMKATEDDNLNPMHYKNGIECFEYISSHNMSYEEGNVIKYITRYKNKNGLEDLKKARWYLDKLIQNLK